jgi:hypothetical protein
MKKLIIATNLGHVRVLKYRAAGEDPIEQQHLIEEPAESATHHVATIQDAVTDQSGRFGRGDPVGMTTGMSHGEDHNLQAEMQRGIVKKIAARIENLLEAEGRPHWILAAPQPLLARLREILSPNARKSLASTVGADLTRWPLAKLEARFCDIPR